MMQRLLAVAASLFFLWLHAALLFRSAGRWDLPMFWAYLGVWAAVGLVGSFSMDPDLIEERMLPGPGGRDYGRMVLFLPLFLGQLVVAGLDVGRYHWSDGVPRSLQIVGLVALAAALAVVLWASTVNRFFSSVVRIQRDRGHRVVATGPYRFVRHPAYAVCPLLFAGTGLALGSWLSALVGVPLMLLLVRRTAEEDRLLQAELEGYAAYAEKVRYRLLPGVW
jgi:protein-S-isoprenylcysteine O-methyltransferase Ste14